MEDQVACFDEEKSTTEVANENGSETTLGGKATSDTPQVGMLFDSIDEVRDFYKNMLIVMVLER